MFQVNLSDGEEDQTCEDSGQEHPRQTEHVG